MLTAIDFATAFSEMGIESPTDEIPSMLLAEYFRAAATSLYDKEPISSQRLIATVESRLKPLGYDKNRFADECFGSENETVSKPLSVMNALDEIGDFVRVDGGRHYPAEARFVSFDDSICLIASALPTVNLESRAEVKVKIPALSRLVGTPPRNLPEQSVESWLRTPTLDFASYASERMGAKGAVLKTDADQWQVYDASRKVRCWINARELSSNGPHLCRFQPEGVMTFHYGIAYLTRAAQGITCNRFDQLSFPEHVRVRYGLHVRAGVLRSWFCRTEEPWCEITVSNYEGFEILRLLHAFSVEWKPHTAKRTKFWFSAKLQPFLARFLTRFGINLVNVQ